MTRSDRSESRLAALSAMARGATKPPTAAELDRGLGSLRARLASEGGRGGVNIRRVAYATAVLACVVAAAVVGLRLTRQPGVTERPVAVARIEGAQLLEGGYLSEVGHAGVKLEFNEGSRFVLTSGTRGRLRAVTADGARFALDHGTVAVRITRNPQRRWWVEAGPFVVAVRGTDFTVVWEPASERLAVQLRDGHVAISGPVIGEELLLRPGQNLTVNLAKSETIITQARPGEAPEPSASPAPPLPSAAMAAPGAASSAPAARPVESAGSPTERRWRKALANGEWDRILADVERDGVPASLKTLSSDDLFALADAARYRRRPELARAALLAQRERFPNSPRALDALFLLGRVEELRAGGRTAAIARYDEYLARGPSGTYAAEALGRKMILVRDAEGPERARRIAEEYLARFPGGSYADAARGLSRAP